MSSFSLAATYRNTGVLTVTGDLSLSIFPKNTSQAVVTGDITGNIYFRNTGNASISGVMGSISSGPFAGSAGRLVSGNFYASQRNSIAFSGLVGSSNFSGTLFASAKGIASISGSAGLPSTIVITDSFPEANGTNLNGLMPEVTNLGALWETGQGTWQVTSNTARSTSDANVDTVMTLCGTDGTYQCNIVGSYGAANDRDPAIWICAFDKDNGIIAWPRQTTLFLTKYDMGALAGLTSAAIANANSGTSYPIKVVRAGNVINVYWNNAGTPTFTYTLTGTDTKFANYPYAGFYLTKLGTGGAQLASWDNFSATAPPVGLTLPLLIFDGDSLTVGVTLPSTSSYPYQAVQLLNTPANYCWVNKGVSGQTIAQMLANEATKITNRVSSYRSANVAVEWGGSNDITSLVSPTTVYNNKVSYCQNYRAAGGLAFTSTILPRTDMNATALANRTTLNTNIRNTWQTFADGLVDWDSSANLQDPNNATYFLADKIHLTAAGYAIGAALLKTGLNSKGLL